MTALLAQDSPWPSEEEEADAQAMTPETLASAYWLAEDMYLEKEIEDAANQ